MAQYLVFDNPAGAPGAFLQKEVIVNWDNVKYIEPVDPLSFKLQLNNGGNIVIGAAVSQSSAVIEKIREVVRAQAGGKILRIKPDFIGQWTIDSFIYNINMCVNIRCDAINRLHHIDLIYIYSNW